MSCIDELLVSERVVMAPMAGVTDRPFRDLCRRFGARLMVSEMLASDVRLYRTDKSRRRLGYHDEPGMRWVQIAGADPSMMAEAARFNEAHGADVIDINMGCPAKKVCSKAAGSALLRDERLVARILAAVVEAVDIPVTLKTRLGWCPQTINATRIARIAADCGIRALTLHGRTRACRFGGEVRYDEIARVRAMSPIPVIANGDITSPAAARDVIGRTGADAVMIGRAAQGRPWLIAQAAAWTRDATVLPDPDAATIARAYADHIVAMASFHGTHRIARKHVGWYLDTLGEAGAAAKQTFNRAESVDRQLAVMTSLHPALAAA